MHGTRRNRRLADAQGGLAQDRESGRDRIVSQARHLRGYARSSHFESMEPSRDQKCRPNRDCFASRPAMALLDRIQRVSGRVRPDHLQSNLAVVLALPVDEIVSAYRRRAIQLTVSRKGVRDNYGSRIIGSGGMGLPMATKYNSC
jgi:hypothetical protein